jgi:hypothetical protein
MSNQPFSEMIEIQPDGTPVEPPSGESEFVTDAWLANQLQMAVATIRSQRFKRLHGHDHWLNLSPVYIGSKPRYRRSDAIAWLQSKACDTNIEESTAPASGIPDVGG